MKNRLINVEAKLSDQAALASARGARFIESMLGSPEIVTLALGGLVAGFVDAIAGGGGLITLPILAVVVGAGSEAIGTNKIAGLAAALTAFLIYWRKGNFDPRNALTFSLSVAAGSFGGSLCASLLGPLGFKYLLFITAPFILWMIWNKDIWVDELRAQRKKASLTRLCLLGVVVGFYDGFWGPGGGTLMFLVLLLSGGMPLLAALATSKLANSFSAGFALAGYALQGKVQFVPGAILTVGVMLGATQGAALASKKAARIVRPTLLVVVCLLLLKFFLF